MLKGTNIAKAIDILQDNFKKIHPSAIGYNMLEISKFIGKKSQMVNKEVIHANIALNTVALQTKFSRKKL